MEIIDIDQFISNLDVKMHKDYNGLFLTEEQVTILNHYGFDYKNYKNLKELIFDLENYLNETECEELDTVFYEISEFDYYHNTNK